MDWKDILKKFVPEKMWSDHRKRKILRIHGRVGRICSAVLDDYESRKYDYVPVPKINFGTSNIIWQYWGQGFDGDGMTDMLRMCLSSIDKYAGNCVIVRLSDKNIEDYIDLPDFVKEKRSLFSLVHFSDLLRLMLLKTYGGVWLDATIWLSAEIPERYFKYDFFMFQRDMDEKHKDYWEKSWAYYWGWYPGFKVRVLNSIIFARKNSRVIGDLTNCLLEFWRTHKKIPYYFFFQILFNEYISRHPELNCPVESDAPVHCVQQILFGTDPFVSFHDALRQSFIHKMSYRKPEIADLLSECIEKENQLSR